MCRQCATRTVNQLVEAERGFILENADVEQFSICLTDHTDHVHIKFNRGNQAGEWTRVNCSYATLETLLPPLTSIHLHVNVEVKNNAPVSPEIMESLKKQIKPYASIDRMKTWEENDDLCCICHENMESRDQVSALNCTHVFHHACFAEWLTHADTCPTCRQQVDESNINPKPHKTPKKVNKFHFPFFPSDLLPKFS